RYGYQYDKLNRLKNAIYGKNGLTTNAYNESLTYDKNGNILSLKRNGDTDPLIQPIGIDDLIYTYAASSNQLGNVADNSNNTSGFNDFNKTGNDYTYDANGNMTTDKNKNITAITYNHLNLPTKITFGTTGHIAYIYNASGQKTGKTVFKAGTAVLPRSTTITDYLQGGFQYSSLNSKTFTLDFFPTAEGYAQPSGSSYEYVYQYKDHLGNVRLSYSDKDNNGIVNNIEIIEESNYYPFGFAHKGYNSLVNSSNPGQKYRYNGKELQDENIGGSQLNWYDFGARNYDAAIGRWVNIDPLAEISRRWSSYTYCYNNPIRFVDPDGMLALDPGDLYNLKGEHVGNDGIKDNAVYLVHTNSSQQLTQTESKRLVAGTLAAGLSVGLKVEQKDISNDELNLRASLSTLKQTEAGSKNEPLDYNSWNNNKNFTEDQYAENPKAYNDHPGTNTDSGGSAAGAYQFLARFYQGSDFSPKSQDAAAVNNMTSSSFTAAKSGSGEDFKVTTQARWTSLQHFTGEGVQKLINNYRAQELKGSSGIATPVGQLVKTKR
ncbi:type IV secretion protein Rhs, partial [Flavobacterium cupreum]